ncbi:MAG: hypothetical protein CEO21_443 [Microgenomates group bacterium Gr01-1014_80]|nr:MAG: hypothetical protein CEO21_443 [Microgenomates group bacterium Gr01-1014_80]
MKSQKGITQVLVLLLLVAGLGAGLILSQQTQIFKPRAQEAEPINIAPPSELTYCSVRIADFSVSDPCDYEDNGFRRVRFSCSGQIEIAGDQAMQTEGDHQSCKSLEDWVRVASSKCESFCGGPSPSPEPSVPPGCIHDGQCPYGYTCEGWICPDGGNGDRCIPGKCVQVGPTTNPPYPSRSPQPIIYTTPTPSPEPQPVWPPFTTYCPDTNDWRYPWQSCP